MDKEFRIYTKGKKYNIYNKVIFSLASAKKYCNNIREKGYTDDIYIISSKTTETKYNLYVVKGTEFFKSETIDIYNKSLYPVILQFALEKEEYHKNCLNLLSEVGEYEDPIDFTIKYITDFIFRLYERDYLNLKAFI